MIRTCDGTDQFLIKNILDRWIPCDCGAVFDDAERMVVWPHERIGPKPSYEELVALARAAGVLDEQP
jgi:hypothetical protein